MQQQAFESEDFKPTFGVSVKWYVIIAHFVGTVPWRYFLGESLFSTCLKQSTVSYSVIDKVQYWQNILKKLNWQEVQLVQLTRRWLHSLCSTSPSFSLSFFTGFALHHVFLPALICPFFAHNLQFYKNVYFYNIFHSLVEPEYLSFSFNTTDGNKSI